CSYVGHGTLRMCVMGAEARPPSAAELSSMRELLGRALDEGAVGLASGLIYPPSAYGTMDELVSLCEVVRAKGGLYASHIRNEGGSAMLTARLRDPAVRARIRDETTETGRAWDRIVIARARHHLEYSGRTVADLAAEAGKDPLEWTCDTLVEHDGAVDIIHHS